jgi:DNA-binding transcriptional regulator YdaS (Cro superfamily)
MPTISHEPPHIAALRRAIALKKNQEAFGALFGKSQQLVSYWISSGQGLPSEFVLSAEAATGIPRWELRPDIYPPNLGPGPAATLSAAAE